MAGAIAAIGLALGTRYLGRPDPVVPPSPFATKWRYATEQDWIVAHVVQAIADMAHYGRTGAAPDVKSLDVDVETVTGPTGAAVFAVRVPGHDAVRLTASDHIWSPAMYAPLAAELLGPAASVPPPSALPRESATFAALTRPRTDVIVAESARVSSALAAQMTDAEAHEDAALLYATLGLREWAGQYYDNHRTLCRLAAHLAMAEALRKGTEPGPSARVAEATLLTLAFRDQRGVLRRLDAFEAQPRLTPAARAWSRSLRMRNTEDWRLLPDPEHASLLERREYFVWLNSKLGHGHALEYLDRTDPDGLSDWGSVILSVGYSVEAGHRFVPAGMAAVMSEVSQMPLDVAGGPDAFVRALNEEPAPGPVTTRNGRTVVEVVDTGTWADFAERHLMHHIESGVDCMRRMWGLRDEADQYKAQMQAAFGGLRQFPIAARRMARSRADYAAAMPAAITLLLAGPEWVGGHNWNLLLRPPDFPADTFAVPAMETWCRPLFPAGTYFEWPKRLFLPDGHVRVHGAMLQQMHDELPYYGVLAEAAAFDRLGMHPRAEDLKQAYGPLLDYDVRLMVQVAEAGKDDPAAPLEYERLYRKAGELDPDRLRTLGYYLVDKGKKEEAAAVFEQYEAKGRDRVGVCNSMGWLVNYHEDHKNGKRALELAKEAAGVYCFEGLFMLADLYERRKQWANAEKYYRAQSERYDVDYFLMGFYLRVQEAEGAQRFRDERQRLLGKLFPKGLERVETDPVAAPSDGVLLVGTSAEAMKAGLKPGDVLVAVNGFRVHTYEQYRVIRSLKQNPQLDLVVWRGSYRHVAASPPQRWFGVQVRSYNGPEDADRKYL